MEDQLYYLGSAVKSTAPGTIKGYAIRFGSPNDTDLENDYFSPETDFGRPLKVGDSFKMNLYYHHGQDSVLKSIPVGSGIITMDDKGLWMEAQIDMANEYGKMIDEMAKMGKLGYSSGATSHLVERQKNGKSYLIKSWPIGEVSVTPTPAESRNKVMKLIDLKYDEMPMNGQYEDEEVEDMVEGLVDLGATPEMLVESIYAETNAELVSEAIHKLFYSMCEGLDTVLESGYSIEYVNALIDGFSVRAKDVAARLYDQPMAEMQSLKLYTNGPKTVREIEKCLRDVMHFSTNQSKALAGIIKDNLRDEIIVDEIKNKNISSEEEVAIPVVNDDNIKNALMKKLMLDLMR